MALPSLWPSRRGGEPFEPLASFRRRLDRLFEGFGREVGRPEAGPAAPRIAVGETES
jgi:hypothetical protein